MICKRLVKIPEYQMTSRYGILVDILLGVPVEGSKLI
jgi:hypothetical protein